MKCNARSDGQERLPDMGLASSNGSIVVSQ